MLENEILINEDHLTYNYKYYKNLSKKNIIAVLKANAYGHGLIKIARILDSLNVYMIAISNIQEGIYLRQNCIKTKILLLEPIEVKDMLNCYYYHLTPVISSLHQFNKLCKAKFFASLPIHLKIDSGMHRLGVNKEETIIIKEKLNIYSNLKLTGIFTHLIGNEKEEGFIANQIKYFEEIIDIFNDYSLCIHMASSSSLDIDNIKTNATRIGLGLYGLKDPTNTKQVLSLSSPIINNRQIKQNEYAAYNNSFKAPNDGYIYTIPLGYQSGILLKYKIKPTIDNKPLIVAGNKCMNQTLLFSKHLYFQGEMVSIINEKNTLLDLANRSNVSIYELICLLNSNIKRIVV
jgi:alanine racemase